MHTLQASYTVVAYMATFRYAGHALLQIVGVTAWSKDMAYLSTRPSHAGRPHACRRCNQHAHLMPFFPLRSERSIRRSDLSSPSGDQYLLVLQTDNDGQRISVSPCRGQPVPVTQDTILYTWICRPCAEASQSVLLKNSGRLNSEKGELYSQPSSI